jgi:hypothetical protein
VSLRGCAMAGRGPVPKAQLTRPTDEKRRAASITTVTVDGLERGPELPSGDWPERTIAWWQTWRTSPMAQTFSDTDWDFLVDTALLHAEMWSGNLSVAAELRIRQAKFGATPEDRMRLKIAVDSEASQVRETSQAIPADRRRRLLKAVGDGA